MNSRNILRTIERGFDEEALGRCPEWVRRPTAYRKTLVSTKSTYPSLLRRATHS